MIAAICRALSALLLVLGLHPFITYPLSLRLFARVGARRGQHLWAVHAERETFAILVCAYNEEASIERKLANMLALRRRVGELEILVYVDAATDRTAELLEPYRNEIALVVSPTRCGKVHGMNLLAERAKASVLVFTDANVILEESAIDALGRAFADPRVGCVCGHLIYVNAQDTPTAAVGSLYWRLEEKIKDYESAFGSVMGADGSVFALRRSLHRAVPLHLLDDMFLSLNALCSGYRVVCAKDAIAFEKSVTAPREEFFRKVRIACQGFNGHRVLWPRIRRLPTRVIYMYFLAQAAALAFHLQSRFIGARRCDRPVRAGRAARSDGAGRGRAPGALVVGGLAPREALCRDPRGLDRSARRRGRCRPVFPGGEI